MKPMSDLCWMCQQNSSAILRATNKPESVKLPQLKKLRTPLSCTIDYKTICDSCCLQITSHFKSTDNAFTPPPPHCKIPYNSNDISAHYSFDYAQQVHFPADPLQPGPIFFLTPRKCSIFGVHCKAIPRQINFLTDEAADCGKGVNVVISQFHYFFSNHGLGEKVVDLHRTEQKQLHGAISYVALLDSKTYKNYTFIFGRGPYKIRTCLVLWPCQKIISPNKSQQA